MKLDVAVGLCKQFEGFRPKPYLCPAGIPTIGFGSIAYPDGRKVTLQDSPVDEATAEVMLMHELQTQCAPAVLRFCPGLAGDENRFNALASFVYNLGAGRLQTSTLRKKVNAQDWEAAKEEIMRWIRGGGRVLPGLVTRRQAEAALL